MLRLSSVTHAFNMSQYINMLSFSQATGGLNVVAPSGATVTPPGFYMLFILNGSGVPSIAKIVQVGSGPAAPTLTALSPSSVAAGGPAFTLTVTGSNFVSGPSVVRWNGADRLTTFVSATQLTAAIPATDIAAAGSASVTVGNNNPPGGPVSNALTFTIGAIRLQFSAATYSVGENAGNATVMVTRTGGSSGAVSVSFATSNGTATASGDYTAVSQPVSFANGDTANKTISIPIINDTTAEPNETVNLTLSNPTGGATVGSPNPAVLTITAPAPAPLTITTSSLPNAKVGTAYSAPPLAASGGMGSHTWTPISSPPLPDGLSLSNSGVITGTPTSGASTTAPYRFTVEVKDAAGRPATKALTIKVNKR